MKLPPSVRGPIQRRKEERQLLENSSASAVFSRALNNKDKHVLSKVHTHTHRKHSLKKKITGGYHPSSFKYVLPSLQFVTIVVHKKNI